MYTPTAYICSCAPPKKTKHICLLHDSTITQLWFNHNFNNGFNHKWPFQEPKLYRPHKAYVSGLCKQISPQNMAKNMVLTYLHFRILKLPSTIYQLYISYISTIYQLYINYISCMYIYIYKTICQLYIN